METIKHCHKKVTFKWCNLSFFVQQDIYAGMCWVAPPTFKSHWSKIPLYIKHTIRHNQMTCASVSSSVWTAFLLETGYQKFIFVSFSFTATWRVSLWPYSCSLGRQTTAFYGLTPFTRSTVLPARRCPHQATRSCSPTPKFLRFLYCPRATWGPCEYECISHKDIKKKKRNIEKHTSPVGEMFVPHNSVYPHASCAYFLQ